MIGDELRKAKNTNSWNINKNTKENFLRRINIDTILGENSSVMEKRRIILDSDIICTTVSGAGSKSLVEASYEGNQKSKSEFDVVIIDEACQVSEQATLIPFKYNPKVVILVGDPQQLPVFVRLKDDLHEFGRSFFVRLQRNGFPVQMLRYQYRMHPEISTFPSRQP